jgi:hypothetical protein
MSLVLPPGPALSCDAIRWGQRKQFCCSDDTDVYADRCIFSQCDQVISVVSAHWLGLLLTFRVRERLSQHRYFCFGSRHRYLVSESISIFLFCVLTTSFSPFLVFQFPFHHYSERRLP